MANDPALFLSFSVSFRIPSNRFYSGFAISRTGFRHPYLFVCIETRLISISSFRRGSTCFLWGSKAMSTSNCTLSSPPPRPRPEGRAQTRSSGAADSPCVLCSPPARPAGDGLDLRSPLDGRVAAVVRRRPGCTHRGIVVLSNPGEPCRAPVQRDAARRKASSWTCRYTSRSRHFGCVENRYWLVTDFRVT